MVDLGPQITKVAISDELIVRFKDLIFMGVVRSRQGSGSYLASSATDILRVPVEFALAMRSTGTADLFETRKTIEVKLAELAASRRNEGDLDLMRTALARMRASMGI